MTSRGFWIQSLSLTGHGVPDATLRFTPGLNVVVGPSDTGKTFAAQCVDYALGASRVPKEIPQARGYTAVSLELHRRIDGQNVLLQRGLPSPKVIAREGTVDRTLAAKHNPKSRDTVSALLLDMCELAGARINTAGYGKTRPLSFRDVARLTVVSEEDVIAQRSPILSGQVVSATTEKSVFRFILGGIDDSDVVTSDDPQTIKSRRDGRISVIRDLIAKEQARLAGLDTRDDAPQLRARLVDLAILMEAAVATVNLHQQSAAKLEQDRRQAWTELRRVESRLDVLAGLQERFVLLQEQYNSDLQRLEAIALAGHRLGEMREERCPVCGAAPEHHDATHQTGTATPNEVTESCRAESSKIASLMTDLKETIAVNRSEIADLNAQRTARRRDLESASEHLRVELQPRIEQAITELRKLQAETELCHRALDYHERLAELSGLLADAARPVPSGSGVDIRRAAARDTEEFSLVVQSLLAAWHFPGLQRVTFDDSDQDIVVSGERRASHGKGVRAVTHAAFTLGLLRYCADRDRPYPGCVLIDSPLIVYREPDDEDHGFSRAVKDAFYENLAATFREEQVIVFENDPPPASVTDLATIIRFTGTENGRQGFIPTSG